MTSIVLFRNDLRIIDNPALLTASSDKFIPIYIHDPRVNLGGATKCWLKNALSNFPIKLNQYCGNTSDIIIKLSQTHKIKKIYWNKNYEYPAIDTELIESLKLNNIEYESFNATLLWEPSSILKNDGSPYRVFTPFFRQGSKPRLPLPKPTNLQPIYLEDSDEMPYKSKKWHAKLEKYWNCTEDAAWIRLKEFIETGLPGYKVGRDFPAQNHVSRLSPYLHFGHISPNSVWHQATSHSPDSADLRHFLSEIGWREFSYYLLHHFPDLPTKNFRPEFDTFPWKYDKVLFEKWCNGCTGYELVDAGMKELWETGYMHNRVRMITASFLVKNLGIHWHYGQQWFNDCLLDADLANNSASWQWVAGCGADAAPYFRIFNPILQKEKFDPDSTYINQYISESIEPIIDFSASREIALDMYKNLKTN